MDSTAFITRIEQAGFALALNGDRLRVTPASHLTHQQKEFIRQHRDELIQAVRLRDKQLESSPSGNDLAPANDPPGPVRVIGWTPAGYPLEVTARDPEHAAWILRMNPPPIGAMQA